MDEPNLRHRYFRLAVLNIMAGVTVPLAGLVDTAMLGHLADIRFLAGVALGSILFDYVYWTFGFLRMATTGTTARAVGEGKQAAVYLTLYRGLFLGLAIGAGLLALQVPKVSRRRAPPTTTPASGALPRRCATSSSRVGFSVEKRVAEYWS